MWKPITAATLTTLVLALPAHADTRLSYVDGAGKPTTQVYVKDGKVRMQRGGDGMLFDAASGRFTMIDGAQRSYVVMDAKTMERMAARAAQARQMMAGQMAGMQEQMANMPPEQRAMMEQMMGGLAANAADPSAMTPPKVEMKEMGSTQKVAGFGCKDLQMVVGGKPAARMCVAPLESLDIPPTDRAAMDAMHERIQSMAAMGPGGSAVPDIMPQGLALKYEPEGAAAQAGEGPEMLKSISRGGIMGDLFTVPAGYTEQTIPDTGMK